MNKNVNKTEQNLEAVKQYLTQQGKEFCGDDKGVIISEHEMEKIIIQVSDASVDIQIQRFAKIHKEMQEYLDKFNSILKEGRFETEAGEYLNYRIAFPVDQGEPLQPSEAGEMLEAVLWMADYVFGIFLKLLMSKSSASEAFMWTIIDIRDEVRLNACIDDETMRLAWEVIIPGMEQAIMKYIVPEKKQA